MQNSHQTSVLLRWPAAVLNILNSNTTRAKSTPMCSINSQQVFWRNEKRKLGWIGKIHPAKDQQCQFTVLLPTDTSISVNCIVTII